MSFRAVSLLLLAASIVRGQEAAPKALPVEEPAAEQTVAPGGNIERPASIERSVSRSGMFRVGGGDTAQRSSVALFLETARDGFESLLRDRDQAAEELAAQKGGFAPAAPKNDDFEVPVDVALIGKVGNPPPPVRVAYELRFTDDAHLLSIRVHLGRGGDNELLERAALTVLLYERALRGVKPGTVEDALVVRPWLVEGLVEAGKWSTGRADRRIYEGVFRRGGGFTVDELFELPESGFQRLDGASRLSFRALSGALVMALLEQPGGRGAFRSFCGEAARFSGEMPVLLRKHFPDLNLSERSLAKWWALTLAKLVEPKLSEVLSIRETESALDEALRFHTRDADGNPLTRPIDEWREVAALKPGERVEAVRPADDALTRLSYRCFPSYRAILLDYQDILRGVAGEAPDDLDARLAGLAEQRRIRIDRALRARDYLDYFEISRARELSGEFDDYLRLKEELELRPRPARSDRISDRLDTMQKAYDHLPRR